MKIINHGKWVHYQPEKIPEGWPSNAMFCRHTDSSIDWYKYQKTLDKDNVKCTVLEGIVMAATRDASMLFPLNCLVLEIYDIDTPDPQAKYGRMRYDPEANTLCESHE